MKLRFKPTGAVNPQGKHSIEALDFDSPKPEKPDGYQYRDGYQVVWISEELISEVSTEEVTND